MTETFTLEPENYRPKDIVKYRHLSPSGNRALKTKTSAEGLTDKTLSMFEETVSDSV